MADTPKLVSSMGRAELDQIYVRNYDLNKDLLGKISFAQMVCLMLEGRLPTAEEGRMIDTMLIVLVDHGMTTGAAAARMTFHSAPEAIQGAVAAAILGAGSVHLGSSEHCAKMLHDALSKEAKDADLDAVALKTVEKRLANNQLIPGIGHGIHTGGDPRAATLVRSRRGDQGLWPQLRAVEEDRQDRRPESRQAFAGECHRRHRSDLARHGISLADVEELRDPRPRLGRPRSCRRRNPPAHRPRHIESDSG